LTPAIVELQVAGVAGVAVVFMLLIGNQFVVRFYDSQCVNVN